MMDWINDFMERFKNYPEIQQLRADKLHGKLEINFSDGISMNYNLSRHRRADSEYKDVKDREP